MNILNPLYYRGFNDGYEQGKKDAVKVFEKRLNKLAKTKGIGDKTIIRIAEALGKDFVEIRDRRLNE